MRPRRALSPEGFHHVDVQRARRYEAREAPAEKKIKSTTAGIYCRKSRSEYRPNRRRAIRASSPSIAVAMPARTQRRAL